MTLVLFLNQLVPEPCIDSFTPFHSKVAEPRFSSDVILIKTFCMPIIVFVGVGGTKLRIGGTKSQLLPNRKAIKAMSSIVIFPSSFMSEGWSHFPVKFEESEPKANAARAMSKIV